MTQSAIVPPNIYFMSFYYSGLFCQQQIFSEELLRNQYLLSQHFDKAFHFNDDGWEIYFEV
jgi:hypothetical protein